MRWSTAAAALLLSAAPALAADVTTGLSLACPWENGFAACVRRWPSLVPPPARTALDRCAPEGTADECARKALERVGIRVLERTAVEAERDRHLGAWAAQRTAQEQPAIRRYMETAKARADDLAARKTEDEAKQARTKATVDDLLVALQADDRAAADRWWTHRSN